MQASHYFCVRVFIAEDVQQHYIDALAQLGIDAFEQQANTFIFSLTPVRYAEHKQTLNTLLAGVHYEISERHFKNWNADLYAQHAPIALAKDALIYFEKPFPSHAIYLQAGTAFGTAEHATTKMMITRAGELDFSQKRVLDIGTGTGILAILAERWGAREVVATECDPQALTVARVHIMENNGEKIHLLAQNTLPNDPPYDIIFCNMHRNFIISHARAMCRLAGARAVLLLSGFLVTDTEAIEQTFDKNLCYISSYKSEGWGLVRVAIK